MTELVSRERLRVIQKQQHAAESTGFVLFTGSLLVFALYLIWLLVPDAVLVHLGLGGYFPRKYWALVLPVLIGSLWVLGTTALSGRNLMLQAPLNSWETVTGK